MRKRELFISTISAWEVAILVVKERLSLALEMCGTGSPRSEALPFVTFVPLSTAIAVESVVCPAFPMPHHR